MKINNSFNLSEVRSLLLDIINDPNMLFKNRVLLYRFLDKLTDSNKFAQKVNQEFSAMNLKLERTGINDSIAGRESIQLNCDFYLKPVQTTNWELYFRNELFLSQLDESIARKIAFDINTAFAIKSSRMKRGFVEQ